SGQLRNLMLALDRPASGQGTNLAAPLKRVAEAVRKRGLMVVISDFLAPVADLESNLLSLNACGHDVILFQVLDPAERTFRFSRPAMFEDAETGKLHFIDPASARKQYLEKLDAHCGQLRATCQKLGLAYFLLDTERPLEMALFEFLKARMHLGKRVRRIHRQTNRAGVCVFWRHCFCSDW